MSNSVYQLGHRILACSRICRLRIHNILNPLRLILAEKYAKDTNLTLVSTFLLSSRAVRLHMSLPQE